MLVTLAEIKAYLAITNSTYDAFLTAQVTLISDAIEGYCGRVFAETDWEQTFYANDYANPLRELPLFHWPVSTLDSIEQDDVAVDPTTYRIHKPTGIITRADGLLWGTETVVLYTAGFATIPAMIQNSVYELVAERYNKQISGVNLNFGSDVQRISIPGAIAIDFDYSLNNNERKNAFGSLLTSQLNVLDYFRSERAVVGSGKLSYVEEVGP